jgi:uncharacterized protein
VRKRLPQLLASLAFIYATVCAAVYWLQERLLFQPEKLPSEFRFSFPGTYNEHQIAVDGAQLSALWFRAQSAKGTVFYLHGNAGCLRSWGDVAPTFTSRQYDVFIVDYRGYGKSSGAISSEVQLHDDVERVYQFLLAQGATRPIYIYGRSLGTGLATRLANRHAPRALLLEAPFISVANLARYHYPWLPSGWLLRYSLRNDEELERISAPVYFFHGDADMTIPPASSQTLASAVAGSKRVFIIPGGGHNDLRHRKAYNTALDQALP